MREVRRLRAAAVHPKAAAHMIVFDWLLLTQSSHWYIESKTPTQFQQYRQSNGGTFFRDADELRIFDCSLGYDAGRQCGTSENDGGADNHNERNFLTQYDSPPEHRECR
jgi:hypothetical protein